MDLLGLHQLLQLFVLIKHLLTAAQVHKRLIRNLLACLPILPPAARCTQAPSRLAFYSIGESLDLARLDSPRN
jgi:hypothetical protein